MKKEAMAAMSREIIPDICTGKGVLRMMKKMMRAAGAATASWEKVNPKIIFSLCCSGGGMSYMSRILLGSGERFKYRWLF